MSGGPDRSPRQASAISTIVAESKCARCAFGDSHFWMTRYRPGVVTDAQRSMLRQAGSMRVITTYLASTGTSESGSEASKRMVTMVSSTSEAIRDPSCHAAARCCAVRDLGPEQEFHRGARRRRVPTYQEGGGG